MTRIARRSAFGSLFFDQFIHLPTLIIFLFPLLSIVVTPQSIIAGEPTAISGPGWVAVTATPISPDQARVYYDTKAKSLQASSIGLNMASASSKEACPEIVELARGLQGDPKLVYDYVHNHIDYVPYFGSLKGPCLTLLDGNGNDFDQASLMIALLAGSHASELKFVFGVMAISYDSLINWLGARNQDEVLNILAGGGIPRSGFANTIFPRSCLGQSDD